MVRFYYLLLLFCRIWIILYFDNTVCNQHKFTGKLTRGQIQISHCVEELRSSARSDGNFELSQNSLSNMGNSVLSAVMQKCTELLKEKLWTAPSFNRSNFTVKSPTVAEQNRHINMNFKQTDQRRKR